MDSPKWEIMGWVIKAISEFYPPNDQPTIYIESGSPVISEWYFSDYEPYLAFPTQKEDVYVIGRKVNYDDKWWAIRWVRSKHNTNIVYVYSVMPLEQAQEGL